MKLIISILLATIFFTGCSNHLNEGDMFIINVAGDFKVELSALVNDEPTINENLFRSFLNYQFVDVNKLDELDVAPVITSIDFVSEDSIQRYIDESENEEIRGRRGVLLSSFQEEQAKFLAHENVKEIGGHVYQIGGRECHGDIYGCDLVMYSTFYEDTRVDISVSLDTQEKEEELISLVEIAGL